jgi:hypothetical protein
MFYARQGTRRGGPPSMVAAPTKRLRDPRAAAAPSSTYNVARRLYVTGMWAASQLLRF